MEGKKIKIGAVGKHDARSSTLVNFDEGTHEGIISQIFLTHGTLGIMSIQFQFLLNGNLVLSDHHGPPHEYITGISGEYYRYEASTTHIRCLKFTTNTSEYGPFGTSNTSNEKFAFKMGKSPQFGGFHGTYDASGLQYIGAYLQLVNFDEGTQGGIISQIFLTHGTSGIMSIQFQFLLNGFLNLSDHHGPSPTHEYITGVSGAYHSHEGSAPHIKCLKFTTNTNDYGPFGTWSPSSEKFAFKMGKSSQFGGFHGAYDDSGLHYIGVYLQPKTNPHSGLTMTWDFASSMET